MAEIAKNYSVGNEFGCGFIGGIFQKWNHWPRKPHVYSLEQRASSNATKSSTSSSATPHKVKGKSTSLSDAVKGQSSTLSSASSGMVVADVSKALVKAGSNATPWRVKGKSTKLSDAEKAQSSTSSSASSARVIADESKALVKADSNATPRTVKGKSTKLSDAEKAQSSTSSSASSARVVAEESKALVQAGSDATPRKVKEKSKRLSDAEKPKSSTSSSTGSGSSALVLSRVVVTDKADSARNGVVLGNLKQPITPSSASRLVTMGNIVKRNSCSDEFRGVVNKSDPEALKKMGNQAYKQGRFGEALSLYDKAISLDADKAVYRSNRSAALIGLGRFVEAVVECEEALRIEPLYQRAHHRLASLCLRLGEVEKALHHYKHSGSYATSIEVDTAQAIQKCLMNCNEARKQHKWSVLLNEIHFAISSGADSSPLVFALQAEALLKLLRHEEAYTAYQKGPNLSVDECTNFFGMTSCAYFLMIGSQVYLACGRFEDSVTVAQQAAQLDPTNKEASLVVKRAKAISSARSNGNLLFKAAKFSQACTVYSQGLDHEPHNSVLLCNRAACRSKLGQFEKAVEDCTAALHLQPSYSKARLRRANCNAKLERWEASVQDYEVLIRETPGDEEVGKALFDARIELKRRCGEDVKDMKFGSNLVFVSTNERFRHIVTSPGMSVVLFCNKDKQKRVFQALEQVCKRFPSVNFLKVEVEDHPYLVKMEGVNNVPAFKIYKNGSKVKEIPGSNHDLLESSVKWYSS